VIGKAEEEAWRRGGCGRERVRAPQGCCYADRRAQDAGEEGGRGEEARHEPTHTSRRTDGEQGRPESLFCRPVSAPAALAMEEGCGVGARWLGRQHRRGGRRGSTPRLRRRSQGSTDPPNAATGGSDPVLPDGAARIRILPMRQLPCSASLLPPPLLHHLCPAARLDTASSFLGVLLPSEKASPSFHGLRLHAGDNYR
jgi:hypothetical protein